MPEHTRTLGFTVAFAIGLGTMIAAGIFSLSGTAVASIGSSAVIAFIIAAVVAGITAATYSEFASIYSENGGGYLFSSRTFEERDLLVYAIGASLFLGYTGTTAFYLATMDEWFVQFIIPPSLHALPHGTVGVAAALLLGTLNARGTEESGTFQVLVTGAKVAVLFGFIGGAFAYQPPAETVGTFTSRFTTDAVPILSIAALAFITFFGFSAIAASAGEIIEPRKTVPKAIAASILTVTVLYTLVIVAMVNSPVPAEVVARQGETAMGRVAEAFLGSIGLNLIVAGAVFSMVSASNASVLAASGIGSLMGRQGQAPRRFSRIHPVFGTPFWSVATATATIVFFIVVFIGLFPAEGPALFGVNLGLTALTGFATLNLLVPLSAVNLALVYSRRRFPDIERGFSVPLVPLVPAIGIVANLALISNLPTTGIVTGAVLLLLVVAAYVVWGGAPSVEELYVPTVSRTGPGGESVQESAAATDRFRVLVPIARPSRAPTNVRLAARLAAARADDPILQVVNVTHIPEQTPSELVVDTAEGRADAIRDALASVEVDVPYTVEGHISRDVAFDILHTARDDGADLIVVGYPEDNPEIAESVEYDAPCDVVFIQGFDEASDVSTVTIGAGGGPHHRALLPLAADLAEHGTEIHVVSVTPTDGVGTVEVARDTVDRLPADAAVDLRDVTAETVADGLVSATIENGGILLIGATRTRELRRWVFGSTADRVVARAGDAGVPVIVYASPRGVVDRAGDLLFPAYRRVLKWRRSSRSGRPGRASER